MKFAEVFDLANLIKPTPSDDISILNGSPNVTTTTASASAPTSTATTNPLDICSKPWETQINQTEALCYVNQTTTCSKDCLDYFSAFSAAQKDNNCDTGYTAFIGSIFTFGDMISISFAQYSISCVKVDGAYCPDFNGTCDQCFYDQLQLLYSESQVFSNNVYNLTTLLIAEYASACNWTIGSWGSLSSFNIPILIIALLL